STQNNDISQPDPLITADVGDNVTLHCFILKNDRSGNIVWYQQKLGYKPRVIVSIQHDCTYENEFKPPKFNIEKEKTNYHLKIAYVETSDEAVYYCGYRKFLTRFGNGTFLAVKDDRDVKVSVWQHGMLDSVPAGASVTLQCSVLSEIRSAELQVLWFRAAPPQSHPQIIYTHHNSSHQCESGSSTHTCVYNFTKSILSLNDTDTYYCAVALCGKIIFGNGTQIQLVSSPDPAVIYLTVALAASVVVIFVLIFVLNSKRSNCKKGSVRLKQGSVTGKNQINLINQSNPIITAHVGENVTLHCFRLGEKNTEAIYWFKQKIGHEPWVIVKVHHEPVFEDEFQPPKFTIEKEKTSCHLKIANVEPSDEAMYYCGIISYVKEFGKGTFLSVRGNEDVNVMVWQRDVSDSVPAGASVTLQCSVLSESRSAELQVLWFRAAPPQSHPQIIYTHHNSSHQCESGSSTHTCVYNFTKNILSLNDTGTYYCAVALCGKIIFGNGTRIQLEVLYCDVYCVIERSVGPVVICLAVALAVCVVVIFALIFVLSCEERNDKQHKARLKPGSVTDETLNQDSDILEVNYAALHFNERRAKRGKVKKQPQDIIYSDVQSLSIT
ncbi:hypothetical protein QTP70_018439, partial [Hemibagrus guttatus]